MQLFETTVQEPCPVGTMHNMSCIHCPDPGLAINFGVMISKLKRDKLMGDIMAVSQQGCFHPIIWARF